MTSKWKDYITASICLDFFIRKFIPLYLLSRRAEESDIYLFIYSISLPRVCPNSFKTGFHWGPAYYKTLN